ncbi:MAG: alpha/beta hydrolase, partial [Chloroflexi bacterium]|nr:alpha/beta hydrolase [Chloroflexota bacterium]
PQAGPYTPEMHARDLAALLDALGIEHAHFVGLSNGGIVLMHFAKLFPERMDRLVFADTFSHVDAVHQAMLDSWRAALVAGGSELRFMVSLPWTWGAEFLSRNRDAVLALRDKAAQLPTYSSMHLIDGGYDHDARPWLGSIGAPTLIIHGSEDRMDPLKRVHTLHEMIPHSRLLIIEGAGHAAWLEKADEFNRVLLEFLMADGS